MILEQRQALPLDQKVALTKARIREWYNRYDDVYLSFSGGKDSTVLLDIVKSLPFSDEIPAVYCDTGLEYPEVRDFALKNADVVLKPEMTFKQVIEQWGYPVISKEQAYYIYQYRHTKSETLKNYRWNGCPPNNNFKIAEKWKYLVNAPFEISDKCCFIMKKRPFKLYEKETGRKPIIATMAEESRLRWQEYKQHGCNGFNMKKPKSTPMGFWTEQDVLWYIVEHDLSYASCYGDIVADEWDDDKLCTTGCTRTGCMFCMFGVHVEDEPNRFQKMKESHPKQYDYCINKLKLGEILDYIGVPY